MTFNLFWKAKAIADLEKLPHDIAKRITKKMRWYISQENPLVFAKPLKNSEHGALRFRVGNYRVLCDVDKGVITVLVVLTVRHRKDAYRL